MLNAPFLTLPDPRAKIKGSRDPLGLQMLWTKLGRQVVQNLTTVTTSVRGFSVLLLALHFAERAITEKQLPAEKVPDLFLKFEQLAAYSRVAVHSTQGQDFTEDEIRGIQRVKKNLVGKQVRISVDPDAQILSNQKTYGLWGLYTVAARNSRFIEIESSRLTEEAHEFIWNEYDNHRCLTSHESDQILDFICRERRFEPAGRDVKLARRLAALLGDLSLPERDFYQKHLVECAGSEIQTTLWRDMRESTIADEPFSMQELSQTIKCAERRGHDEVARRLFQIQVAERVFAPATYIFNFMTARDGQSLEKIANEVKQTWGARLRLVDPASFAEVVTVLQSETDPSMQARLMRLSSQLAEGNYLEALSLLLEQNRVVMQNRGGLPWITMKGKSVSVTYKDSASALPAREELAAAWTNTYFLNALKAIGYQIEGKSR